MIQRSCVVITYNTRRCLGTDGRTSPERIARVLAELDPDIVALQELDQGAERSGRVDQARVIANTLGMESHFHPSFNFEEGSYGNAILARHPVKLMQAGALPTVPGRQGLEPRGAIWAEVSVGGTALQVLTTHLGLTAKERTLQSNALLGEDWVGSPRFSPPALVLGDLNAWPSSRVVGKFRGRLRDTHRVAEVRTGGRSFPSRLPLLRLDYIFSTSALTVLKSATVRTPLTALASDHLPVMAKIFLGDNVGRSISGS